ncbi:MAG: type III-A CRISPR-associated RAMP protein Csm4 [bacterium]
MIYLCKIKPKGPLLVNENRAAIIHSDTIFGLLINKSVQLFGEKAVTPLTKGDKPPFFNSSVFPFYKDILFLPRPLRPPTLIKQQANDMVIKRSLNEIKFLSPDNFFKFLEDKEEAEKREGSTLIGRGGRDMMAKDKIMVKRDKEEKGLHIKPEMIFDHLLVTREERNELEREGVKTLFYKSSLARVKPYPAYELRFNPNIDGGLYFFIQINLDSGVKQVMGAVRLLQDEGLGGGRSTGGGAFELLSLEEYKGDLFNHSSKRGFVTLSLYHPREGEVKSGVLEGGAYQLVTRGGFIGITGLRKKRIRLFSEGSCFRNSEMFKGQILDLTPEGFTEYRVYQHGMAFKLEF